MDDDLLDKIDKLGGMIESFYGKVIEYLVKANSNI